MPNEIKNLLDDIVSDTNSAFPNKTERNDSMPNGVTFDAGSFREKLSMYVLKDIVCAMMADDTKDVDGMIDEAIMKHIHDNYDGSCYGYLCRSRDRLKSPNFNVFGSIIQEIDERTKCAAERAVRTKNIQESSETDVKELLEGVENYDQLREKLKKQVSEQVVNDVVKVITKSSDAPVFDDIDSKIEVKDKKEDSNISPEGTEDQADVTSESFILRMCGNIVTESAIAKNTMSTEEGFARAVIGYCINEMDRMCKQRPKTSVFAKYL